MRLSSVHGWQSKSSQQQSTATASFSFSFFASVSMSRRVVWYQWSFISQIFRRGSQSQTQPWDCPMRLTFPVSEVVIVVNRLIRKCSFDELRHVLKGGYTVHSAIADEALRSSSLPRPWCRPNPMVLAEGPCGCLVIEPCPRLSGPMLTLRLLPIGAVAW